MGLISDKAKHREWRDFVNFVKEDPQTLLSIVSNAEPVEKKTIKNNAQNNNSYFFSPKSQ
jgi:predicted HAD superfamily hydrolase